MLKYQLNDEEIGKLLAEVTLGHLATVSKDGQPYVIPLNFVILEGKIYFHGRGQGQKIDNLSFEPRVCFEAAIEDGYTQGPGACSTTARFRSAIAVGTASIVEDKDKVILVLTQFSRKYAPQHAEPDFPEEHLSKTTVIEVTVTKWTGKYHS
jgi:nitroimidazol reductase NimA-like FMN-containing flavoprotein (pyridoxamine 5'-phosphate oxidase superfamily)